MKMMQQFGLSFADCDIIMDIIGMYIFIYLENVLDTRYWYNTNIFLQISLFYGLKKLKTDSSWLVINIVYGQYEMQLI